MSDEPPVVTVPRIAVALAALSECLCAELTAVALVPCWCGVLPGQEVALDYCSPCESGQCGMAWVRLDLTFPADPFPLQVLDASCEKPLAYRIEMGVAQCVTVNDDGEPLSTEQALDTLVSQTLAMEAMRRALSCCTKDFEVVIEGYQPFGPQGGCVGGVWSAYVGLD